ncbi:hypothetical protein LCGC14_2921950 [marine sediment metagenome]|uniref:Uncharacterized protein n=1 Tax=marine sediment metagenome TaxID=412755 RepID=A0A0F8ZW51_9ZZZZ
MKSKIKTNTEVKLKFDYNELKIVYSKLVSYCGFDPKNFLEIQLQILS